METAEKESEPVGVGEVVALLVLPFAIYLAGWRIDWEASGFMAYLLPVAFCVIVPSVLGSIAQGVTQAIRR